MEVAAGRKGIITIAQGKKRYIDMAVNLALSLKRVSPDIPLAVITDSTDGSLKEYFDVIIPVDPAYGIGLVQKLHIYDYSCFDETLFIDADCLAVRPVEFLFDAFKHQDVCCIGHKRTGNKMFGMEVTDLMARFALPYLIGHNGGVYYFKKAAAAKAVFDKALELLPDYDKIGIERLRGHINEEPLLALAMSMAGISPYDDKGEGMRTPVGQKGEFKMDILKGYCEFYKHGEKVKPAIMHFGGAYPEAFHYRREIRKLKLSAYLPAALASFTINAIYNPSYILYVFAYRISKKILKGGALSFSPSMPMFRFE